MTGRARCELDERCTNPASVHLLNPSLRVCAKCAEDLQRAATEAKFPRAGAMLQMVAAAEVLKQAARDLEELAGAAPAYEVSTLRRKARGIIMGALAFSEGTISEAES